MKKIGFGTYRMLDFDIIKECLKQAIKSNYDYIDTAYIYRNEKLIGRALKVLKKEGLEKTIKIQTKIWPKDFNNVKKAVLQACKKLGVEKLDMCLLHRRHFEVKTEIKAWKDLIQCQQEGLIDEIGVSNFDRDIIEILRQKTGVYPAMNQIELSANNFREDRVVYNKSKDIAVQAWSPMGDLEENLNNKTLLSISKKHKTDVPSILIAFLASQNIEVVVKSSSPERVIANKKALKIKLTKQEIERIRKLNTYKIKASESYEYKINE